MLNEIKAQPTKKILNFISLLFLREWVPPARNVQENVSKIETVGNYQSSAISTLPRTMCKCRISLNNLFYVSILNIFLFISIFLRHSSFKKGKQLRYILQFATMILDPWGRGYNFYALLSLFESNKEICFLPQFFLISF